MGQRKYEGKVSTSNPISSSFSASVSSSVFSEISSEAISGRKTLSVGAPRANAQVGECFLCSVRGSSLDFHS